MQQENLLYRIKKLRREKGLSQSMMADKLFISQATYAKLENGKTCAWAYHLWRIAEIFDIEVYELFLSEGKDKV